MNKFKITLGVITLSCHMWGCEYNQLEAPVDCESEGPVLSLVELTNADCGDSNGTVELSITGGVEPIFFSTSSISAQSTGSFASLVAGTYSFIAEDANGCQGELEVTVENKDGVSITSINSVESGCGGDDGEIEIIATGGASPYMYKIDDESFQEGNTFSNLEGGTYTVHVTDDENCEFSQEVEILSGISLSDDIVPIIDTNCAVPACHGGSQSPDLRNTANIIDRGERIMSRTADRSMPPDGYTITQTQIDEIACWVSDGTLDN